MTSATQLTPAEIRTEDPGAVIVTRDFAAPPAAVWRAYTEPALLRRWMSGMPGWTMTTCEMDVREGGTYRWKWEEDGTANWMGFHGTYRAVAPGRRTIHEETFDPGTLGGEMGSSIVTTGFEPVTGGTRVTTRIDFQSAAVRATAMATGMTDGMELSYRELDALLAEG